MAICSESLNILSICTGGGGLDLGVRLAIPGARSICMVERESFAVAHLVSAMEAGFLDAAPVWSDARTFDGCAWRGAVDIVTAGYPCQPFSVAGNRRGADDPRHIWPHVARIIGEAEPPFVFLENVAHHLRLGFPEVAGGLVGMGYRLAAGLFTAAEVGAPHKRERLFILACREHDQLADLANRQLSEPGRRPETREGSGWHGAGLADADGQRRLQAERGQSQDGRSDPCQPYVDDADGPRSQGWCDELGEYASQRPAWPPGPCDADGWKRYLRAAPYIEPSICRGADGLAAGMDDARYSNRIDRLRMLGNGVVPLQAAYAVRTLAHKIAKTGGAAAIRLVRMMENDDETA